jgi:predicted ATPase
MMLKTWSIHHFKAFMEFGDIHQSPVTVITGLNSPGKTSLLQSILMVGQTFASRLIDRALLSNERIVQLGTFEDLTFPSDLDASSNRSLQIAFAVYNCPGLDDSVK